MLVNTCVIQVLPAGQRQYEEHITRVYDSLKSYRNDVIAKWNSKTRLISGKLTNKVSVHMDGCGFLCWLFCLCIEFAYEINFCVGMCCCCACVCVYVCVCVCMCV